MAYLALVVASDALGLVGTYWFDPYNRAYATGRMQAEVVPTMVHILGLASLAFGLALTDRRASPISRQLTRGGKEDLKVAGWTLAVMGIGMKMLALYLWGIRSLAEYLDVLYAYDVSTREFGLLDQGVAIAAFGMALLAICYEPHRILQASLLTGALVLSVLLSTSKSGLFLTIIPFYLLSKTFSTKTLKAWSGLPVLGLGAVLFVVGLGVKTQVKYGGLARVDFTPQVLVDVASSTVQRRFSGSGLYQGYTFLVNRLIEDPSKGLHFAVIGGIFTGIIPRFVWNEIFLTEKPQHPFHAMGRLIHEDYLVAEDTNYAPTLVGFAFADFGFWTLIPYLLLGGMLLGRIRRFATSTRANILVLTGYVFFASLLGPAISETGFLNILYAGIWAALLMLVARAVLALRPASKVTAARTVFCRKPS
jgi:hypothetical protein